jgi:EAL domain-containing protein (putative c-di-GMP-specific phosphodiesterase class I)
VKERSFTLQPYPVVATDGSLIHQELMLRLTTEGSVVPAAEFIPMAIRVNRIAEVDLIAVALALDRIADMGDPVAVNLCGISIEQPGFIERVIALLRSRPELTERLSLEIGETSLADGDGMSLIGRLSTGIVALGCRLGIDEFGRHFSAMPRLYAAKIDYVKIDGSFIGDVDAHPENQHFIEALVQVARSLSIATYAEHVSTEAERRTLVTLGINAMTGPAVLWQQ